MLLATVLLGFSTAYPQGHPLSSNAIKDWRSSEITGAEPALKGVINNSSAPANGTLQPGAIIAAGADVALKVGIGLAGVATKAAIGAVADAAFPAGAGLAGVAARAAVGVVAGAVVPIGTELAGVAAKAAIGTAVDAALLAGAGINEVISNSTSQEAVGPVTFAANVIGAVADAAFKTVVGLTGAAAAVVRDAADATFKTAVSLTSSWCVNTDIKGVGEGTIGSADEDTDLSLQFPLE